MMKITSQVLILPLLLSLISCGGGDGGTAAADLTANIAAPAGLAVIAGEYAGQASLSWNSVTGATEYSLYYATESFAGLADVANYASLANGVMLTNQTSPATIRNLNNNTTYYFVVTSGDGSTESSASSEVSALIYAPLNDTGITTCSDETSNGLVCPHATHPGQDAEYGRDFSANDDSDGHAGFSYNKLDSSGTPLADQTVDYVTTPWSCVQDNVTGLIWEVKTDDTGLHDKDWTYTWYNSTDTNDGGDHGIGDTGDGTTTGYEYTGGVPTGSDDCANSARCDTEKYVADVNSAGLCGAGDWRLPSKEELLSLIDSSVADPGPIIDSGWFPNTIASSSYWSASPRAGASMQAWLVNFGDVDGGGGVVGDSKHIDFSVRLVRGGQ